MPPDLPTYDILHLGAQYLLPVALVCGLSLLLTLLWLVVVWKYLSERNMDTPASPEDSETAQERSLESDMARHLGEMPR